MAITVDVSGTYQGRRPRTALGIGVSDGEPQTANRSGGARPSAACAQLLDDRRSLVSTHPSPQQVQPICSTMRRTKQARQLHREIAGQVLQVLARSLRRRGNTCQEDSDDFLVAGTLVGRDGALNRYTGSITPGMHAHVSVCANYATDLRLDSLARLLTIQSMNVSSLPAIAVVSDTGLVAVNAGGCVNLPKETAELEINNILERLSALLQSEDLKAAVLNGGAKLCGQDPASWSGPLGRR